MIDNKKADAQYNALKDSIKYLEIFMSFAKESRYAVPGGNRQRTRTFI